MGGKIAPKHPILSFLPSFSSHILTYPSLVALREFVAPLFCCEYASRFYFGIIKFPRPFLKKFRFHRIISFIQLKKTGRFDLLLSILKERAQE